MRKKQFYEAPDAELLVVRFEENFCQTGPEGTVTSQMSRDEYEYEEI